MTTETDEQAQTEGVCPRCESEEVERQVILQTTRNVVAGVVFFCETCGLTTRALTSDREAFFFAHKSWQSEAVPEETLEAFNARWQKRVMGPTYGPAEPLGPILPKV